MSDAMYGTMSLRTVKDYEPRQSSHGSRIPPRATSRTDDIDGAQPAGRLSRVPNKPDLRSTLDVEGAQPRSLSRSRRGPNFVNRVDDIEGARPRNTDFKTSRALNPLDPDYKLPSCIVRPPTPPRLLRETQTYDDVPGTKPQSYAHIKSHETMRVEDIEGAQADWKPAWQRRALASPPRNPLAVDDITHVGFKTKRVTDPLRPRHTVHGMTVEDGEDTYPRHTRTPRKEDRRFTTADIEGAQTGWRPHYNLGGLTDSKRRTFRNPVATQDVPGAQANTVRRCIRTNRHINPNAPDYTALDGKRLATYTRPSTAEQREAITREAEDKRAEGDLAQLRSELERMSAEEEEEEKGDGGGAASTTAPPRHPGPSKAAPRTPQGQRSGPSSQRSRRSSGQRSGTGSVSGSGSRPRSHRDTPPASRRSTPVSRGSGSGAPSRRVERERAEEIEAVRSLPSSRLSTPRQDASRVSLQAAASSVLSGGDAPQGAQ